MTQEELATAYEEKFGKPVPVNKKNDLEWQAKKLEEPVKEKEEETFVVREAKKASVVKDGEVVREYNTEVHGEDYKRCAESFAKKIGGEVK